jgi:hypothetical protein
MYSTFNGLEKWYKHEFEKFGWIVISKDADKVREFQRSIMKLRKHLDKASSTYEDHDKLHDIAVMSKHLDSLINVMKNML